LTFINPAEVRRYLGIRGESAHEATEEAISRCTSQLQETARPRVVTKRFSLTHPREGCIQIEDVCIESGALSKNLTGCPSAYLMAATLGVEVDRLIARAEAVRMSDAVIFQAAAATMIEQVCDDANDELREEAAKEGLFCRPRFSPGYGDFPLSHQRDLVRLLDASRQIGLTVTGQLLLAPIKSVTALIGLSDVPLRCAKAGCEVCAKIDCTFRRLP
jgi:hypothetical protein